VNLWFRPALVIKEERMAAMIEKDAYIKGKGITCPFCGSRQIEGGFVDIEAGKVFQEMGCTACQGSWQDVYELIDVIPRGTGE
jgi:formate dehydrogenase maturation protein FdhE